MRQKIQDIIQGKFEYNPPSLLFASEKMEFYAMENEVFTGAFSVKSSSDVPIRGMVTCEHPNIRVKTVAFAGTSCDICFSFSGNLSTEGEEEHGVFVLTTTVGEYLYPFRAEITRYHLSSSAGRIKSLAEFAQLCRDNPGEALTLFSSPQFTKIFHENSSYNTLLYAALTAKEITPQVMEEFLIATGQKPRVVPVAADFPQSFSVDEETDRVTVLLRKSHWGYLDWQLSCNQPGMRLAKTRLSEEDFAEDVAAVELQFSPQLLHVGKNHVMLQVKSAHRTDALSLVLHREGEALSKARPWTKRRCLYLLEEGYLSYCLTKKSQTAWVLDSIELLQEAMAKEPTNYWWPLFLAFLYLNAQDDGRMQEQLQKVPRVVRNAKTPVAVMWHYLAALRQGKQDMEEILLRLRDAREAGASHPVLLWLQLQVDPQLKQNPAAGYGAICRHLQSGSLSPILYVEAALMLQETPEILGHTLMDDRILGWMARRNLITHGLALTLNRHARYKSRFLPSYFRLLTHCHAAFPREDFVKTICVYLINTGQSGEAFFPWFSLGVQQNLQISGLYKAYLLSWTPAWGELPNEVIHYFYRTATVPAKAKAALYAYVATHKQQLDRDWSTYMEPVKAYAMEELAKGNINDRLAKIYGEIRRMMTITQWRSLSQQLEYCYHLSLPQEGFVAIRVTQSGLEREAKRYPLRREGVYFYLNSSPYVILAEGKDGRCYALEEGYTCRKMLPGNTLGNLSAEVMAKKERKTQPRPLDQRERLEQMAGPIGQLKDLFFALHQQDYPVVVAARQLMSRMLFMEQFPPRHEEIFAILQRDSESSDLLMAYASVFSRRYLLYDEPMPEQLYLYLGEELYRRTALNPYARAAFLRLHLQKGRERYQGLARQLVEQYLFCGQYFSFFSEIPPEWQKCYLLAGIRVISHRDIPHQTRYLSRPYGAKELMREVLPGLYTCPLRLMEGEVYAYTIVDGSGEVIDRGGGRGPKTPPELLSTRYGMLVQLQATREGAREQSAYATLCDLTNLLFIPVKE